MSRSQRRLDRVKQIPLSKVLHHLGYGVSEHSQREQQFSCDLHGDGRDSKPSARLYNDEVGKESWFCFACGKARDAVSTYKDKYGISFVEALSKIEKDFNLPSMDWGDEPYQSKESIAKNLHSKLEKEQSLKDYEQSRSNLDTVLLFMTKERSATLPQTVSFWEAFDKINFMVRSGIIDENKALDLFQQIRAKVYECF